MITKGVPHTVRGKKMNRPPFEQIFMDLAVSLALRSTCLRRNVGCCITTTDFRKVLSIGYNGNASKLPNECERPMESGNCGCLHAEENAIINCSAERYVDKIVFTTCFPCVMCAKRIINLGGVKRIIYKDEYRNTDSLNILLKANIELLKIDEFGNMWTI